MGISTAWGGHSAVKAHVRVIAATHQNLEQRVKDGAFREDLFHRLNVIRLRLPPLRERREDVPALARHFLQQSARQLGVEPKRIADNALARLAAFQFPGNVRQLENICHWLTVMAPSQVIEIKDLPPEVLAAPAAPAQGAAPDAPVHAYVNASASPEVSEGAEPLPVAPVFSSPVGAVPGLDAALEAAPVGQGTEVAGEGSAWDAGLEAEARHLLNSGRHDVWDVLTRRFETRLILTALAHTRGRRIEAAQKLGIGRNTITRKIQELGLE